MAVTQTAMTNIQSIAAGFYAQLNTVDGINAGAVDSIAASARDALGQIASQLNTQVGGVYVFAGQDTANPPVPNPVNILTSGFYTQINAEVGNSALGAPDGGLRRPRIRWRSPPPTLPARRRSRPTFRMRTPAVPQPPAVQVGLAQMRADGLLANANFNRHLDRRRHHRLLYARCHAGAGDHRLA